MRHILMEEIKVQNNHDQFGVVIGRKCYMCLKQTKMCEIHILYTSTGYVTKELRECT